MGDQESLDKFVRRVLKEKGFSLSDVEKRSRGGISDSYIGGIAKGKVGDLTVGKLRALARGLDVSEKEIFAVALGAPPEADHKFQESEFAMIFYKYIDLSDEDKKEVLMLLEVIDHEIERRLARQQSNWIKAR